MEIPQGEWENLHRLILDFIENSEDCGIYAAECRYHDTGDENCLLTRAKIIIEEDFAEWVSW